MDRKILGVLAVAGIIGAGCTDSDSARQPTPGNPIQPTPETARIQVLHASPDAPEVNILGVFNNDLLGVDYKEGFGAAVVAGELDGVQIDGILPDGSTATVFGPVDDIPVEADTLYTILALGQDLDVAPLILAQPDTPVTAGNTRVQVVHGAPNAPEVTVFLTAPDADLTASPEVITFEFGEAMDMPVDVPSAGPYQIRVTLPFGMGETPVVVYDSGTLDALPDGANLVITAVENTNSADGINMGDSPISLVALAGGATIEFQDTNTLAEIRVVHASASTPAVDVIVNDDLMNPFIGGLEYPDFAPEDGFAAVPADSYDISVVDSDTQTLEPINIDGLPLEAGVAYDVLAINEFPGVEALLEIDDYRRLETAAKVRIIHASTVANTVSPAGVDIYVTAPDTMIEDVMPTIENFEYADNTGFIQLAPGEYKITVTADGSKDAAIGPVVVEVEKEGIYTAIARDPGEGETDLGLILMDDDLTIL